MKKILFLTLILGSALSFAGKLTPLTEVIKIVKGSDAVFLNKSVVSVFGKEAKDISAADLAQLKAVVADVSDEKRVDSLTEVLSKESPTAEELRRASDDIKFLMTRYGAIAGACSGSCSSASRTGLETFQALKANDMPVYRALVQNMNVEDSSKLDFTKRELGSGDSLIASNLDALKGDELNRAVVVASFAKVGSPEKQELARAIGQLDQFNHRFDRLLTEGKLDASSAEKQVEFINEVKRILDNDSSMDPSEAAAKYMQDKIDVASGKKKESLQALKDEMDAKGCFKG